MSFEYSLILLILFIVALVLKLKFKIKVFKSPKEAIVFYLPIMFFGTIWDNFAVFRGHWFYPGTGTVGIFIGLIPIEDYLFAMICSYLVIILYKVFHDRV